MNYGLYTIPNFLKDRLSFQHTILNENGVEMKIIDIYPLNDQLYGYKKRLQKRRDRKCNIRKIIKLLKEFISYKKRCCREYLEVLNILKYYGNSNFPPEILSIIIDNAILYITSSDIYLDYLQFAYNLNLKIFEYNDKSFLDYYKDYILKLSEYMKLLEKQLQKSKSIKEKDPFKINWNGLFNNCIYINGIYYYIIFKTIKININFGITYKKTLGSSYYNKIKYMLCRGCRY